MVIAPGEILPIRQPLIEPGRLDGMGTRVTAAIGEMASAGEIWLEHIHRLPIEFAPDTNAEDYQVLAELLSAHTDVALQTGIVPVEARHWLIHQAFEDLAWHADTAGDIRVMTCLGEETGVDIARSWDPKDFGSGGSIRRDIQLADFDTIPLPTGASYMANNLAPNSTLLRPHRTRPQPGRLVLRSSFYPEPGWSGQVMKPAWV